MIKSLKKTSIADVARVAGVSKATVSRVLNQKTNIDPKILKRVQEVMAELDYVPRRNCLRAGHQTEAQQELGIGTVSFVFPGFDREAIRTPLSLHLINGAEKFFFENDINMITAFWQEKGEGVPEKVPVCIQNKQVDGIMFRSGATNLELMEKVRGLPVVRIFEGKDFTNTDIVDVDNDRVGQLACQTLVEKGHRRLGLFGTNFQTGRQRAFIEAAEDAGIEVVFYEDKHHELKCINEFISDQNRPEAVFHVEEDQWVDRFLGQLLKNNLKPGRDIDVAAVTHEPTRFTYLDGEITMISIQAEEIGYLAGQLLLDLSLIHI